MCLVLVMTEVLNIFRCVRPALQTERFTSEDAALEVDRFIHWVMSGSKKQTDNVRMKVGW